MTSPQIKVLIIDDEPAMREITAVEFRRRGFEVLTAGNGADGLAVAEKELPAAIILDLIMPGFHGFEVLSRIRNSQSLKNCVIIVRSGKSYKPDIDKALELGADAYVVKPGELEELVNLTVEHVSQRAGSP